MKKIKIILNDGSTMSGSMEIEGDQIKDLLNDKTTFLEFFRPDGKAVLLSKGYIAYILPDEWNEDDSRAKVINIT